MNLSTTIIPKSDQLNADDLLAGPLTIKITAVKAGSAEQPVVINYEGDNGRPYKPGKSMRRVLIALWGSDGAAYVGRRLSLYADPDVKFGGVAVGGIRISHASDIKAPLHMMLTETRGKKKPFVVEIEPIFAAEQLGPQKAREGTAALRDWFAGLPAAVKTAVKGKLDADWKPIAADSEKEGAR